MYLTRLIPTYARSNFFFLNRNKQKYGVAYNFIRIISHSNQFGAIYNFDKHLFK